MQSKNADVAVNATVNLSTIQKQILEIIRKNLTITINEVAEESQKHRATIIRNINILKEKGYIVYH